MHRPRPAYPPAHTHASGLRKIHLQKTAPVAPIAPPVQPAAPSSQQGKAVPCSMEPSDKCIFIIDDSPTVRLIVQTALRREGYEVQGYNDGLAAFRALAAPQARIPDLVVLDIGLPKMDGYEVARRLKTKEQFNHTILIMLTRRDGIVDRLKGRLAGAKAYLTKPFRTQELVAVIQELLAGTSVEGSQR